MKRVHQCLLIGTSLPLCWLLMQEVHELGHVLMGLATGGRIIKVVVHPLTISRTDVLPNPHPTIVVWGGPIVGVLLPLMVYVLFYFARIRGTYLVRFLSGFCLIANGAYIGIGSLDGVGDAGEILRQGAPLWGLWLFGILTVPLGFLQWHGLGRHFGLGEARGHVDAAAVYISIALLALTLIMTCSFSSRL